MVVHIGLVVIAVAFTASSSYGERGELRLAPGQTATFAGHRLTYLGTRSVAHPNRRSVQAEVRVDGGRVFRPSLNQFPFATQAVGTPSVRSSPAEDVYLTLVSAPRQPGDPAVIGVVVQPLIVWLWVGGGVMAAGTFLAVVSGRKKRRVPLPVATPPEPVPEPVPEAVGAPVS
jgi:cytochrome c-type biogenesis protein CcmF